MSARSIPGERPDTEGDEAREGTCAAWVADTCITENRTPFDMVDMTHSNGWVVDTDMARHLVSYVDMAQARDMVRPEIFLEYKTDHVHLFGTSDLHSMVAGMFCIDDLKFGYDIVEPTSWQLAVYLTLAYLNGLWAPDSGILVRLGIFQPRALHREGEYRTNVLTPDEATQVISTVLERVDYLTHGMREGVPGSYCNWCPKAIPCEALTQSIYTMWSPVVSEDHLNISRQQMADEMDMLTKLNSILKARTTAVKTELEETIDAGVFVPGYVKEPRTAKRQLRQDLTRPAVEFMTGVDPR